MANNTHAPDAGTTAPAATTAPRCYDCGGPLGDRPACAGCAVDARSDGYRESRADGALALAEADWPENDEP